MKRSRARNELHALLLVLATSWGCACGDEAGVNAAAPGGDSGAARDAGPTGGAAGAGGTSASGGTAGIASPDDARTPDAALEAAGQAGAAAAAGTSPDAGDASDAREDSAEADANTEADADPDADLPISEYCGDSIRDPVTEECDDGPGTEADSCSDQCRVTALLASPLPPPSVSPSNRFLGLGRHPTAFGPAGYAIAVVDISTTPTELRFSALDAFGRPITTAVGVPFGVTSTSRPFSDSHPVVAALPDRTYAAAWTDLLIDGDIRGIALRRIDPATGPSGPPQAVNQTTFVNQENPDIVWTGSELVVAWIDRASTANRGDVHVRTYDPTLTAKTDATPLSATTADDFNVALTAFGGSYAAAWRSYKAGAEVIEARSGASSWTIGPIATANSADRPGLVALDASHLAVVFTLDNAPTAQSAEPRLAIAVLDTTSPGATEHTLLDVPPVVSGTVISQTQPTIVRFGADLYVAWRESSVPVEALWDELWLKRVPWSAQNGAVVLDFADAAMPLVRPDAYRQGDQRVPALVAGSMSGLLVAWNDYGQVLGASEGLPDVLLRIERVPFANLTSE